MMLLQLAIGWLLPVLTAAFLVSAVSPPRSTATQCFNAAIAVGLGLGLGSCGLYLWLALGGVVGRRYLVVESVILIPIAVVLAVVAVRRRRSSRPTSDLDPQLGGRRPLVLAFVAIAIVSLVAVIATAQAWPHGQWDAFAIWNMHARFLYRAGEHWKDCFADPMAWTHPDYPLLLPAAVSRSWCVLGTDSTGAAAALSIIFAVCLVATMVAAVTAIRDRTLGLLAGLSLLATDSFLRQAAAQYADIPLSLYMLGAVALVSVGLNSTPASTGCFFLAGLASGLAAWMKNEGLLFVVCLSAVLAVLTLRRDRTGCGLGRILAFALGLLPVLALLFHFKLTYAPSNDLVRGWDASSLLARIRDPARHVQVGRYLGYKLVTFSTGIMITLVVCGFLLGRRRNGRAALPLAVFLLMLCGYYFVYVVTPVDLAWHLEHSARRLLLQVYPIFVFAVFMAVQSPEELPDSPRAPAITG